MAVFNNFRVMYCEEQNMLTCSVAIKRRSHARTGRTLFCLQLFDRDKIRRLNSCSIMSGIQKEELVAMLDGWLKLVMLILLGF